MKLAIEEDEEESKLKKDEEESKLKIKKGVKIKKEINLRNSKKLIETFN
jgi:hypothetical protein